MDYQQTQQTQKIQKVEPGQRIVVLGMGISGRAAVKFLLTHGAEVSVSESREFTDLAEDDQELLRTNTIAFEGGGHSRDFLSQADAIIISPGIPTDSALLDTMRRENIPVLGELALAAPYLREQVVAVTGTNGKTTVTALIGELLKESGKKVFVGGNIGTPILDYLRHGERADVLVLELSSFQLESAGDFRPHIGVLLNVTPDHLDRHKTMAHYTAAKMKMFAQQKKTDKAILCGDDPICQQLRPLLSSQEVFCFGNVKSKCAAQGRGSELTLTLSGRVENYSLAGTALESHTGLLNSGAAVLAVSLLGCQKDAIETGLRLFVPDAHRLQHVRSRLGVKYFNDSKATNTGAVFSALASFAGNIILIAGGRDKGEDYTVLKEMIREKVKNLIVLGEAGDAINAAVGDVTASRQVASMEEAVAFAAGIALPGDVVLLAPACASFDMFDSYGHRGEVFMAAVRDLSESRAEGVV